MSKKNILFISDVHLGSRGCNAKELLGLLKKQKDLDKLFIVGDFIDGWLLKSRFYWKPEFTLIIRKILSLAKNGTEVIYVVGNHDDFLRDFLPLNLHPNIEVVNEYVWEDYLITHGDLYDGVIKLKWLGVLGSWGYELAIYIDRTLKAFGYRKSFSKYLKDRVKGAIKFVTDFENQLAFQAYNRGLKGVICGHIHTPNRKIIEVQGEEIEYLNCGDWIENNSYIVNKQIKYENKSTVTSQ
jgi:UDP-2,3-diacylglucosamine pyrophosphatase LpxH